MGSSLVVRYWPAGSPRRVGCECGAALFCMLGPGHLRTIFAILDDAAPALASSPDAARSAVAAEVEARLSTKLLSPLADPTGDSRVASLLWSTHGAFPPVHGSWVVLRLLGRATEREAYAVLGSPQRPGEWIADRVARRARSFRLVPGPVAGPDLGARTRRACEAVRRLGDRLIRIDTGWARSIYAELHYVIHLMLAHRRVSALPDVGALRQLYLGPVRSNGSRRWAP